MVMSTGWGAFVTVTGLCCLRLIHLALQWADSQISSVSVRRAQSHRLCPTPLFPSIGPLFRPDSSLAPDQSGLLYLTSVWCSV